VGPEPEAAGIEEQGLGWKNSFGTRSGGEPHLMASRLCLEESLEVRQDPPEGAARYEPAVQMFR